MSEPVPGPWLLLRGLAREAGHWGPFLERFRAAFPGSPVATLDLPGCGVRHRERAPGTVAALVEAVRAARAQARAGAQAGGGEARAAGVGGGGVQRGGPVWLVALSLGGMVALEWLRRYPEEVAGAAVLSSSAGGVSAPFRRCRPGGALRIARISLARSLDARERQIFALTSARPELAGAAVAAWTALARQHPVSLSNALRLLGAGTRFHLPPGRAPRPTLFLAGARDRLVHPGCSRALARSLGGGFELHPQAGHDLPLDAPDWVVERLRAWHAEKSP